MTNDTPFDRTDTFEQTEQTRVGERGSPVLEEERTATDLASLTETTEQTAVALCTCGAPYTAAPEVHRCVQCDALACPRCVLRLHRRQYCPRCAEHVYELDKRVFLSLLFLQQEVIALEDLLQVETVAEAPVEIAVDHAATVLTNNNYVDTDTGTLTPDGQEALHVGKQLYGEDGDVQSVVQQLRVQDVSNTDSPSPTLYDQLAPGP
ncbi:hypothetical protein [Natronococcus occultus]|uniref:Uncharacterized protein n=1 Tax=Natronococcus occultus SP4 TaxID=694430 RepID=L0JX99_9EURY|nr:hypothetical protein [Natronococcus occultus]AGB36915.1 hypothetical protein Natoc_1073 [Natronococcus occultus SP4]